MGINISSPQARWPSLNYFCIRNIFVLFTTLNLFLLISCGYKKKVDQPDVVVKSIAIQNSNIAGTEWTLGVPHGVIFSFKVDQTCTVRNIQDTTETVNRRATWKLADSIIFIQEEYDTSAYKIEELTIQYMSVKSLNRLKEIDDGEDDQSGDDFFFLYDEGTVRLLRNKILFPTSDQSDLDANAIIGLWIYTGYYSMADKSFEFSADGTFTYIEGPRAEEKYISLKHSGTWQVKNNVIHLTWPGKQGQESENLHIRKITTTHVTFEEKKETYLKLGT